MIPNSNSLKCRDECPRLTVSFKGNLYTTAPLNQADQIITAYLNGDAFVSYIGFWGERRYLKLREIDMLTLWDEASWNAYSEDEKIMKQRRLLESED